MINLYILLANPLLNPLLSLKYISKYLFSAILAVILMSIGVANMAIAPAWAAPYAVRVFDGDNITLVDRGIKTKVHLACIDAPELLQDEGQHARKVLDNILKDEEIYIRVFNKDKFGRYNAEVLAGGQNANKVMVSLGLAHYDRLQEKDCQGYAELELKAQSEHLGIWVKGTDIVSPSQFRRDNKLLGVGY